jgi:(1->4)-alpha-D-glucan 1-alpha-D-glucosylmutase
MLRLVRGPQRAAAPAVSLKNSYCSSLGAGDRTGLIPILATYRVQFGPELGFDDAAAMVAYLSDLGVSHLYCSPYLQAAPHSTHGYDVVDYHRVSDDLGGAAAHGRLCAALARNRMGQILDIVPNHMAITGPDNPWWWDVLENGPSSTYAAYFDVDWQAPEERLRNMVLIPVLGDQYGRVLDAREVQLVRKGGNFEIHYYDHACPVAPRSLAPLLAAAAERCHSDDLAFIADALDWMPLPTVTDRTSVDRRHRDKAVLGRQITRLISEDQAVADAIDASIEELNANPDALHALLERQNYRLAFWRTAQRELGYRRFFDINSLAGLRMEDELVFRDTHKLIFGWLRDGTLDGVRVDHIDGLREPEQYLGRLRAAAPQSYVAVEKILEPGEHLRESWPIEGTTGYDFLNLAGGLMIDPAGEAPLTDFYAEFTGESPEFAALAHEKKLLVMRDVLGSDIGRLTALFLEVCEAHRHHRDHTRHEIHEALLETIAHFTVYRTYVDAMDGKITEEDTRVISRAIDAAKARRPDLDGGLFDFLADVLTLRTRGHAETELVMRFQQVTGPVMAKAVEDTAFYCFNRLACLNEVGSDPTRFGVPPEQFFRECAATQARWPRTMLATSTHDTKRSGDVRARISLLSEIPREWTAAVRRWSAINDSHRTGEYPDRNIEYLLYQTVVGAWPIEVQRLSAFITKAAREAKTHTSWTSPNAAYEDALGRFVSETLADEQFAADLESFVAPLIVPARINALAQTLLKLCAPGVPDLYQGSELWDLSLVDPDNRRPVDYALRRRLLAETKTMTVEQVWARIDDGLPKMWTIRQALALRRRRPDLFGVGASFEPIRARGSRANHVVAFSRGGAALAIVPRLVMGLGGNWDETSIELPAGSWSNAMTGGTFSGGEVAMRDLLARFPVALLARENGAS